QRSSTRSPTPSRPARAPDDPRRPRPSGRVRGCRSTLAGTTTRPIGGVQMAGSVILAGARTPIGKLSGALAGFSAAELGGFAIKEALARAGLSGEQVDYV